MGSVGTFIKSRTVQLGATYLIIIMSMSFLFSGIIFGMSSNQLDRPLEPKPKRLGNGRPVMDDPIIDELMQQRADEGRGELLQTLILLNLVILMGGSILSYVLARKTLNPIELAMEAQVQFVSDASHELRTPLTALQTSNEVALRKKQLSSSDTRVVLENNVKEIIKLHELTSALLRLARIDNINISYESISIQDAVSEAMNLVVPLAQSKKITVDDKVPLLNVIAHKSSLVQIIRILVENAIKYSPDKSTVLLTAQRSGSYVVMQVVDNGIGIQKADQTKIFTRFYRVDQSRSKVKSDGYGLGLAIAKTICDRQDMKLSVESSHDKGSTFSIQIKSA